jgi:hypothetical protein
VTDPDLLAKTRRETRRLLTLAGNDPDYDKPTINDAIASLDGAFEQRRLPLLNAIKQGNSISDETAELILTAYLLVKHAGQTSDNPEE